MKSNKINMISNQLDFIANTIRCSQKVDENVSFILRYQFFHIQFKNILLSNQRIIQIMEPEDQKNIVQNSSYSQIYKNQNGCSLFLGDMMAASNQRFLKQKNIGVVVTASVDMQHLEFDPQIKHVVYPLYDSHNQNLEQYFEQFFETIQNEKHKSCLVHCFGGISRSASLAISYLMKKKSWNYEKSLQEVRKNRPQVEPNQGFERQLIQYGNKLGIQSKPTQKPKDKNHRTALKFIDFDQKDESENNP